ncbi:larval serum protein 1 alpha chain-like [Zophobas morio]|uniref:larval serum protein 1 alpha chain-like n=1 Tax=Zophobas morio TaxID=2755281 RepID=UPI003083D5E9
MNLIVAVFGLFALVAAYPSVKHHTITDKSALERQRGILELFKHINQPSSRKEHIQISKSYKIEEHYNDYSKPEVAKYFYKIYQYGLLPKGEIFSVFYQKHLEEAIALFKLLYYAGDYHTFYKTAVWARQHVNEGVFLYALSVAIFHRSDTYGIIIPPIHEINPFYFFSSDVIQQAFKYKQLKEDDRGYTIFSNSSGYLDSHQEHSLSYFTEDIGLSSFYYYYNLYYPHWLSSDDYDYRRDRRGETYFFVYQQIVSKYYLERLCNGFGEVPHLDWKVPLETGYHPSLQYPNGVHFPVRPIFYNYGPKYVDYTLVQDYERRIRDAIDKGYVYTQGGQKLNLYSKDGVTILGNLVQSNPDSPNRHYYGPVHEHARHLLGSSYQIINKKPIPSVLEHLETSLRDPAFYQFFKKIVSFYHKYKSQLPPYTEKHLLFEGVEVKKVEFDPLVTYFDYFYADVTNAVYVTVREYQEDKIQIKIRQKRLNHDAFGYKVFVNSDKNQTAVVKMYIGPKFDEYGRFINISENRLNFVIFDHFKYQLRSGQNVIERSSQQTPFYQDDRVGYRELYQQVVDALGGKNEFQVRNNEAYYGIPRRFLLPKGRVDGFDCQFYVFVSPYVRPKYHREYSEDYYYPKVGSGAKYIDEYPLGYPFDRTINYDQVFQSIPNSYFYSAKIYHRNA